MKINDALAGVVIALLAVACVAIIIAIVILCFFCSTLSKALSRCSRRNRSMEPGLAWLNLIPLFNIFFWSWYTAIHVGDSLKREFKDRDIDDGGDYGKSLGIYTLVVYWASVVISNVVSLATMQPQPGPGGMPQSSPIATLISAPFSIAFFVMFILYWVRIASFSRELENDRGRGRDRRYEDDDDDDQDDDDQPRRPSRPSRPDDRIR